MRPLSEIDLSALDFSPLSRWRITLALVLGLALASGAGAAAQEIADGQIRFDPQYHAPGCTPIPSIPTVGRWFARAVLGYDQLAAASADCGLVGTPNDPSGADRVLRNSRPGRAASNGWTYIIWSEQTDAAKLIERVIRRLQLTALVLVQPGGSYPVQSTDGQGFLLVQLDGDDAKPALVWTAGLVKSLDATIEMAEPEGIDLRVESVDFDGRRCVVETRLLKDRPNGPSKDLPCR